MRFKLIIEVNKRAFGNRLPINYQYEQSAAIYRILSGADDAYASWLHDNGFRLENGKTFKFFTYSRFKIGQYRILREAERLQILSDTVEWQIGFLPEKSTDKFIQGIFQNQVFEIGDTRSVVQFVVRSVEVMPEPEYSGKQNKCCHHFITADVEFHRFRRIGTGPKIQHVLHKPTGRFGEKRYHHPARHEKYHI